MYSYFDNNHWAKVKAYRAAHNLPASPLRGAPVEHRLVGTTLIEKASGRAYEVQQAARDWSQGWFTVLTLAVDGKTETVTADASPFCSDELQAQVQAFLARFNSATQ